MQFSNLHLGHGLFDLLKVTFKVKLFWKGMNIFYYGWGAPYLCVGGKICSQLAGHVS